MAMRACGWCKNPLRRGQTRYCSRRCASVAAKAAANAERIAAGRICVVCRAPLTRKQQKFCSGECRATEQRKPRICCVCMAKFTGQRKTCSTECAGKLLRRMRTTLMNARWAAAPFDQPGLAVTPTTAYLMRRPLHTASGMPVAILCWRSGMVVDFPVDPAVSAVIWREGDSVYCEARARHIARETLCGLTVSQMEELEEKQVLPRYRTVEYKRVRKLKQKERS